VYQADLQTNIPPLRSRQLYEHIVERLLDDLRAGRLRPGERLPSERDLARALEVSRSSVREAVAALQTEGVLRTRPGAGSFVADDALTRVHALATDGHRPGLPGHADASPSALLEARALFEPAIAALAATRGREDAYAEQLLESMEEVPDPESAEGRARWNDADRLFHRQVAAMTDNPVLTAIAEWVAEVMDQPLWQRLRDESLAVPGRMRIHMAEHRMIYEAVAGGDSRAAEFYAREHIERVRRYMTLDQ
jgi:DNA-binding FadR family transcriptional regulator